MARGLGVSFKAFNAANGNRFTSPNQPIGGQRVFAPKGWPGIWHTQPGDSYWRIHIERFRNPARYGRALARDATPNRIHPGNEYRVREAPPAESKPDRKKPDEDEEQQKQPTRSPTPTPAPTHHPPSVRGSPWPVLLGIAGAILGAVAAFFGVRMLRGRGRSTPMAPGPVRTGLRVGAAVGFGAGVGLVVLGGGSPSPTVAGLLIAAASVAAAVRSWWTPRQARAPPREVVAAAGRALRAWLGETRIALENTYGFRFPDARAWVGLARDQASWWITAARFQITAERDRIRAVVRALRGWRFTITWEHRAYPTAVQYVVALIPVVGPWLAGSLDLFQLLHLKFKVFTKTAKVWRGKQGTGRQGFQTRVKTFLDWFGRARAYVAKLRYNRAFTSAFPWMTPPAGPEFHWGWFGLGIKASYGNLGSFTVLDLAELGGTTNNRNRVLGLFPVVRVSLQIYVGDFRLDFFLLHFDVPGKKLEQKFATPKLTGWRRLNVPLRVWRWIRVHDLSPWTWKPWQFISQSQWGIGIGPANPLLPNFYEHRGSAQTLEIRRHGKTVRKIHMVQDPGPMLGRGWGRLARFVDDRLGRRVPARLRTDVRILWALVWRHGLAERRRAHEQRLRGRGLRQLDAEITAQLAQLAWVRRELRDVADLTTALSDGAGDPIAGAELALTLADARRALLERLRDQLIETINVNQARRAAIEEGPGSTREPITPAPPVMLTLFPARTERLGVVGSGTLPGASSALGAGRVGFDLGDVMAGRSDPGHPDNPNLDALAGAVRSADGRIFAAVADQQGTHGPHNAEIAVTAAIAAALAEDPTMPAEQVVRIAFAAATEATAPTDSTTTLLLVVITPTGPIAANVVFGWLGDSRGYLVTPAATEQVTTDHTWSVAETVETTPAPDPVQYVTRWIGRGSGHRPDVETRELTGPATIVLTTDELHDFYPDESDLGAVVRAATSPGQAADALIDHVGHLGSGNKTTIVIRLNQLTGKATVTGSATDGGSANRGEGGPIADGVDSATARDDLLPLMPSVVAGARPLRAEEFPHLARGPPGLVNLVRITDQDLLDGRLIGFGWRPEGAAPEEGVIVVPAAVAALVDRLIGLDPAFATWWEKFLRHEWDFHLAGNEHAGHYHDRHAAALAEQFRAATLLPIAFDAAGVPVALDTVTRAALRALLDGLDAQGRVRPHQHNLGRVSPTNLWAEAGLSYAQVDGDAELNGLLAAAGLGSLTVVYLLDLTHNRVIVSLRTSGDVLDRRETAHARAVLEQVVARQARHPGSTPEQVWRGLDAAEVFTGLLGGQMGAVDTLLVSWDDVITGLAEQGAAADRDTVEQARVILEPVEESLTRIGAFLEHPRPDLVGELPARHARARGHLEELRTQLDSITDAQRRFTGLSPEQRDLVLDNDAVVAGYRDILASLTGDAASRRERLLTLLDADAHEVAMQLAAIRDELAQLPPVEPVTVLIAAAEQLQARYEQLRDSTEEGRSDEEPVRTLRMHLEKADSELIEQANVAAHWLDIEIWLSSADSALRSARRTLATLPSSVVSRLDAEIAELTALESVRTLLAAWPRTGAVHPEFWAAGMRVLAHRQALSPRLRRHVLLLLARTVQRIFVRTSEDAWLFLDQPRWAEEKVAAIPGDTAAAWFDKNWSRVSRRARLSFLVLLAATDGAPWLVELPASRRSLRRLADPLRLYTEPSLHELRRGMEDLLADRLWPEPGDAHRGRIPRGQYLGAWLDLAQALSRRASLLARLGRPDRANRMLTALATRVLPTRGPPERVRLLNDITRSVRRHTVVAAGLLLGVRIRLSGGRSLDIPPGSPLWNALVEYRWREESRTALAVYLKVLVRTGSRRLADRAFRSAWSLWLRHHLGYRAEFADEQAPADAKRFVGSSPTAVADAEQRGLPVPEPVQVLIGASTDRVDNLSLGYPNQHCLDCVTGALADLADTISLHPRIVLLRAWERLPDGSRGDELAQLIVMVTDQGILPIGHPYGAEHLNLGPAFGGHLVEWAMATRLPLLQVVTGNEFYDPNRLSIPGFEHIEPERLMITLPGIDGTGLELWIDILDELVELPHHQELLVRRWVPYQ